MDGERTNGGGGVASIPFQARFFFTCSGLSKRDEAKTDKKEDGRESPNFKFLPRLFRYGRENAELPRGKARSQGPSFSNETVLCVSVNVRMTPFHLGVASGGGE